MKKIINKEATFCDHCNKECYVYKCLNCGVEHCYDCMKTEGIEYRSGAHHSGSADGYYCSKCDAELRRAKNNELHGAYITIQNLRMEFEIFYKSWNERAKMVELKIDTLYRKQAAK